MLVVRTVLLAACLLGSGAVAGSQERQPFRSGIDVVTFGAIVADAKGKLVTDLRAGDFEVYEDGRLQKLQYFVPCLSQGEGGPRPPLHLGALFDISGSMEEDLAFARTAAIKFLRALDEAEDYTLVDFDTEVRVARFSRAEFPRLVERIRNRKAEGYTALWDATGVYLDGASSQEGRKVLILYSDGGDNSSNIRFDELMDLLKVSDVTVYSIGFQEHQPSSRRMELSLRLRQIAESTGGQAFFPSTVKELDSVYEKVAAEIDGQYVLGYVSSNDRQDGTWRKVEIKVVRQGSKEVKIRSRGAISRHSGMAKPMVRSNVEACPHARVWCHPGPRPEAGGPGLCRCKTASTSFPTSSFAETSSPR
jgi:Ca-activated chloride channel family protein